MAPDVGIFVRNFVGVMHPVTGTPNPLSPPSKLDHLENDLYSHLVSVLRIILLGLE